MSFVPVSETELDFGETYAKGHYGRAINREYLRDVANYMTDLRHLDHMHFTDALDKTLDEYDLHGEQRKCYRATLGAIFNRRRKPVPQRKLPTRSKKKKASRRTPPRQVIPTVLEGRQFAFNISELIKHTPQ